LEPLPGGLTIWSRPSRFRLSRETLSEAMGVCCSTPKDQPVAEPTYDPAPAPAPEVPKEAVDTARNPIDKLETKVGSDGKVADEVPADAPAEPADAVEPAEDKNILQKAADYVKSFSARVETEPAAEEPAVKPEAAPEGGYEAPTEEASAEEAPAEEAPEPEPVTASFLDKVKSYLSPRPEVPEGAPVDKLETKVGSDLDGDGEVAGAPVEAAAEEVPVEGAEDNIPAAVRPKCVASTGKGQANVDPLHWSLTVEQWLTFVADCAQTPTWKALASVKGEYSITMYDMKDHFVVPFTRGTGCSIALLMTEAKQQHAEPSQVELMLSHAWAGSVLETYNGLQSMVNHHHIPRSTPVFFCVFSMYQPEDGALGGLSIAEQLALDPFARIIESKPQHGMFVCHTNCFEVYERMWTVHEVDAAKRANVQMRGLADLWRFEIPDKFEISTIQGKCRAEDRALLVEKIEKHGGFEQLDWTICSFREQMARELKELFEHTTKGTSYQVGSYCTDYLNGQQSRDWHFQEGSISYGMGARQVAEWKYGDAWPQALWPLGADSYPYGPPCRIELWVANGEHNSRVRNMADFRSLVPTVDGQDFPALTLDELQLARPDSELIAEFGISFFP